MCLLERLAHLGPGARAAADRRQLTMHLEERSRREREVYFMAYQGVSRVGRVFVIRAEVLIKCFSYFYCYFLLIWLTISTPLVELHAELLVHCIIIEINGILGNN